MNTTKEMNKITQNQETCHHCIGKLPATPIIVTLTVKKGARQYCSEKCAISRHPKWVVSQSIYPTTTRI